MADACDNCILLYRSAASLGEFSNYPLSLATNASSITTGLVDGKEDYNAAINMQKAWILNAKSACWVFLLLSSAFVGEYDQLKAMERSSREEG